ncbi:MAG: metalloregulator ArsR/SmtB family transcription factor [Actinomycetota bacterium]|jgi:ArsR family transcriptional regulator|nr:metalloregulator ArsR/SmtB family transcription factor [Actinomycetota bacterium]
MLSTSPPDVAAQLLADPLRARIVALLATETMCTCHLVEETGARQTTVSHHLRLLREADWVETEPCGRFTYYRLRPEPLHALSAELDALADAAAQAPNRRRPC